MISLDTIDFLGHRITNGSLRPDLERVKSLTKLPVPRSSKEQQRVVGPFVYYAQWIRCYSDKTNL